MKPAIGNIVHFRVGETAPQGLRTNDVHPAIIVRVWSDTCVNLVLFTDVGPFPSRLLTSVALHETAGHSWFWPPSDVPTIHITPDQ